jgi:hypothetical protein
MTSNDIALLLVAVIAVSGIGYIVWYFETHDRWGRRIK